MVESGPTIVFAVITEFGTHVTRIETFDPLESVDVTVRHNEALNTIVVTINDESGKNCSMSGKTTKISRPKLRGSDSRGINDELVSLFVESCSCLESSNV